MKLHEITQRNDMAHDEESALKALRKAFGPKWIKENESSIRIHPDGIVDIDYLGIRNAQEANVAVKFGSVTNLSLVLRGVAFTDLSLRCLPTAALSVRLLDLDEEHMNYLIEHFPTKCKKVEILACHVKNFSWLPASVSTLSVMGFKNVKTCDGIPSSVSVLELRGANLLLEDLAKLPKSLRYLDMTAFQVTSLVGIHKYLPTMAPNAMICFSENQMLSGGLGLYLIEGLTNISLVHKNEAFDIIKKYLPTKDIFAAQQELIEAGLEEYAQL